MPRSSQFKEPGHTLWSFAADKEVQGIIRSNIPLYGDRSKTIRALILAGSGSDAQRKLLEQEALMDTLRQQLRVAQDALEEARMATETAQALIPAKKGIDWTKYSPEVAAELRQQLVAKHPGAIQ